MTERVRLGALLTLIFGLVSCSEDRQSPNEPEPTPTPTLSINDRSVDEGSTCLFTVSLDRTSTSDVSFGFATRNSSATAGSDYTAESGADAIEAGELSVALLVPTATDALSESDETFEMVISSVAGADIADSVGLGTILNVTTVISYSTQVQPLLRTSCAIVTCHGGTLVGNDLNLGTNADYLVVIIATGSRTGAWLGTDSKVVQPGNSAISTLYLTTTATPPPSISRMPKSFPALTTAQQNLIRDWIDQGALNN